MWPLSPEMSTKGMCLQSFKFSEKLDVIKEAQEIGSCATGRKYVNSESLYKGLEEKERLAA
jgi:hypothetical protein